ncbi:hypothetical protein [Streptomyces sp. NPDC060027]
MLRAGAQGGGEVLGGTTVEIIGLSVPGANLHSKLTGELTSH